MKHEKVRLAKSYKTYSAHIRSCTPICFFINNNLSSFQGNFAAQTHFLCLYWTNKTTYSVHTNCCCEASQRDGSRPSLWYRGTWNKSSLSMRCEKLVSPTQHSPCWHNGVTTLCNSQRSEMTEKSPSQQKQYVSLSNAAERAAPSTMPSQVNIATPGPFESSFWMATEGVKAGL